MSFLQFYHVFSSYENFLWGLRKVYALTRTVPTEWGQKPERRKFRPDDQLVSFNLDSL